MRIESQVCKQSCRIHKIGITALPMRMTPAILAMSWLLALGVASCSRGNSETAKTQVITSPDPNVIEMNAPERFRVAEVSSRQVFDELHVNGVVAPDVNRTVPVLSLSGGRAVDIRVRLGDDVQKGQVLVRISSPDLASAFSDLQKFRADEILARKQLDRSQLLYDKGAIAQKDLELAHDAEEKAKVDLATADQRLRILGARPGAPVSGSQRSRSYLRNHCRAERDRRHRRALHGQFAEPVHRLRISRGCGSCVMSMKTR